MMKLVLNHKGKILSAALIAGVAILYGFAQTATKTTTNEPKYDYYVGFESSDTIEVTYIYADKSLTAETIRPATKSEVLSKDNLTGIMYVIKNSQDDFIDINALSTKNNVKITASGLSADSKLATTIGTQNTPQFIPVDWSGRIELNMPTNQPNLSFCLHLVTENKQMICHNQHKKVAAS